MDRAHSFQADPAIGTQSADDAGVSLQRSTAVCQTAPHSRVRRSVSIGPLSGRSAHLAHFTPRVDLSDVPYEPPSGSYSERAAHANAAQRPGCRDFLNAPSLISGRRVPYWGRRTSTEES